MQKRDPGLRGARCDERPPRPRRPRDAEATRADILAAAHGLFIAQGYDGAALSDVARAAGVNKSLIHHHFGSKEGLFWAVAGHYLDREEAELSSALDAAAAGGELPGAGLAAYFRFLAANPDKVRFYRVIDLYFQDRPEALGELMAQDRAAGKGLPYGLSVLAGMAAELERLQAAGTVRRDLRPTALLAVALSLVEHWFASGARLQRRLAIAAAGETRGGCKAPDSEEYLQAVLAVYLDGIRPR